MTMHETLCLATYMPAESPAGPAPTITTSYFCAIQYQSTAIREVRFVMPSIP